LPQLPPARTMPRRFGKFRPLCVIDRQRQGSACHDLQFLSSGK
jgi:hypothetical protein